MSNWHLLAVVMTLAIIGVALWSIIDSFRTAMRRLVPAISLFSRGDEV